VISTDLVSQLGLLHDPRLPDLLEEYEKKFMIEADFGERLNALGAKNVRMIIV
jgi:hypothetical protein